MKTRIVARHMRQMLLVLAVVPVVMALPLQAAEMRYPVPSYEGEELAKVREWEKQWAGKKIDATNVDGVKEFIPENLYKLYKDPEKWGSTWFDIVPYSEYQPTKGDIEFTKKYAGTCKIGPNEQMLNHICGIPFPNPQTALEIAYNFDNMNMGDNISSDEYMWLVDGRRQYDRKMIQKGHILYFSGRREILPVPEILPNSKQIFRASHSVYVEPADMQGTRGLGIKYKDRTKDYGAWAFTSAIRRVLRRSTSERQTSVGGTDICMDDSAVYGFAIPYLNYKYLGRKEVLLPRNTDVARLKNLHKEGKCLFDGFQKQRINAYVLECTSKDPNYLYSRMIWYIDPETWYILYSDKYDRTGKLWKIFDMGQAVKTSVYNRAQIPIIEFSMIVDVQRLHSTGVLTGATMGETDYRFQPEFYEPRALMRYGY